jgi:hypothetical protein
MVGIKKARRKQAKAKQPPKAKQLSGYQNRMLQPEVKKNELEGVSPFVTTTHDFPGVTK